MLIKQERTKQFLPQYYTTQEINSITWKFYFNSFYNRKVFILFNDFKLLNTCIWWKQIVT